MSTPRSTDVAPDEPPETDDPSLAARSKRLLSSLASGERSGTIPALVGGGLVIDALRRLRGNRRRASAGALVGGALLGVGLRRRRSSEPSAPGGESGAYAETESIGIDDDDAGDVSDEARAHRERSDVLHESETNPRGVSGEPDVETETDPDDGDVRFTTSQDEGASPKPTLDGSESEDPRRSDDDPLTDDDHVEVDLSEAAMADEASEATGPDPEQAYPSLEGTDPEPMSEKAPPRGEGGAVSDAASDEEDRSGISDDELRDSDEQR